MKRNTILGLAILLFTGLLIIACQNDGVGNKTVLPVSKPNSELVEQEEPEEIVEPEGEEDEHVYTSVWYNVTLSNAASIENLYKDYTAGDFPEVKECTRIDELMHSTVEWFREEGIPESLDITKWHRTIKITAAYKSEEIINETKNLLITREDVIAVGVGRNTLNENDPPIIADEEEEDEQLNPTDEKGLGFFETYGLDKETEKQIIDLWVEEKGGPSQMDEQRMEELGMTFYEFFQLQGFLGTYNDYVIVYKGPSMTMAIFTHYFDDISFWFSTRPGLDVWKDGQFYDIEALYQQGLLTREDIINISENRFQTRPDKFGTIHPAFFLF